MLRPMFLRESGGETGRLGSCFLKGQVSRSTRKVPRGHGSGRIGVRRYWRDPPIRGMRARNEIVILGPKPSGLRDSARRCPQPT
jgi:hypothetical protein